MTRLKKVTANNEFFNALKEFETDYIKVRCKQTSTNWVVAEFYLKTFYYLNDIPPMSDNFDISFDITNISVKDEFVDKLSNLADKYGYMYVRYVIDTESVIKAITFEFTNNSELM